jgi:catechol 2,3-dioxygenase-like lactoylglutathione lyase family enzyme
VTLSAFERIELPCRDITRQRDFYGRVLGLPLLEGRINRAVFDLGPVRLVLRPRGDALFPADPAPGALLAFRVPPEEFDRWHRRLLMARAVLLDPPQPALEGGRLLRAADAEGNVVELACDR